MPLLKKIKKEIIILDAGCGIGSESIFCGLLGAKVRGIDISKNRLSCARVRKLYYEKKFNKKINVKFELKNIFDVDGKYDIIWVNEAISHISPAEKFLELSYNLLKKGGSLIITDSNKLNPYIYIRIKKEQKKRGGTLLKVKDPTTDKQISYAVERCFTISQIKKMVSDKFEIDDIFSFSFFPFFIFKRFKRICTFVEYNIFGKISPFKLIAACYSIICTKR